MTDEMSEAYKDQCAYEAEIANMKDSDPFLTEFPEEVQGRKLSQLIAQTVEQTLAKLREQERAQIQSEELANAESKLSGTLKTLQQCRTEAVHILRLFAGEDADRVNTVSFTVYETSVVLGWNIDKVYGWTYAPFSKRELETAMKNCITKADVEREITPTIPELKAEPDDEIPF